MARVALSDTSQQTLVAAPGAGRRIVVHFVTGSNAGGSLSTLSLKDGAAVRFSLSMAANGGGFALPLNRPWELSENQALNIQQDAGVTSSCSVIYELWT